MTSKARSTTAGSCSPDCTNAKVRQLMRRIEQHYDAEVAACGIRTTQYSLLTHTARLGPVRPVDLAREMKMTPSTLSRNLKPLIALGYLTLEAGDDARSRLVTLTAAGKAKATEAKRLWNVAQQTLAERVGGERIADLHALIDDTLGRLAPRAKASHV